MLQKPRILDSGKKGIAFLSTYTPRECGIATFTKDLVDDVSNTGVGSSPIAKTFFEILISTDEKTTPIKYYKKRYAHQCSDG